MCIPRSLVVHFAVVIMTARCSARTATAAAAGKGKRDTATPPVAISPSFFSAGWWRLWAPYDKSSCLSAAWKPRGSLPLTATMAVVAVLLLLVGAAGGVAMRQAGDGSGRPDQSKSLSFLCE